METMETMIKNELIVAELKGILSLAEREVVHLRRNLAVDNITDLHDGLNKVRAILWVIDEKIGSFDTSETDDELF